MIIKYILVIDFEGSLEDENEISDHILKSINSIVNDDVFLRSIQIANYEHINQA